MYYEVFVSSQRYHGDSALTYSSEVALKPGAIVTVPLQRQKVLGFVFRKVPKPSFTTKPIDTVISNTPLPQALLKLHQWLSNYYPAPSGMITQLFLPNSLAQKPRSAKTTLSTITDPAALPPLTAEQQQAVDTITATEASSVLLHGNTGSGKTRVYVELIAKAFAASKSALVLTPEIGLTPQLARTLEASFPGRVSIMHSELTAAERRDRWLEILLATEPLVVIGPRSSLFAPIANVGIVIIDEAHDNAYKQEQMPYYQATRVAAYLTSLHKAKLILGTATPLIGDYYTFLAKQLPIVRMEQSAIQTAKADRTIEVVNLRDKQLFSRSSWLSDTLIAHVQDALGHQQQALLFLNRRGSARLVMCQLCGWQALCSRCDLPLTFHADSYSLRCHTCGLVADVPSACENCQSPDIIFKSVGTKSIMAELERLFPHARIMRFDSDNHKSDSLAQHYQAIRSGDVDILIGTQILSKGLDLPKLKVVGIVMADTSLSFPDYTAEERTYQMLSQVIGRVGRGHQAGTVIVQSYQPESPVIQAAVAQDYTSFYKHQTKERTLYRFPPFYYLLKLSCDRASSKAAEQAAQKLADEIKALGLPIELIGPSPAFVERVNNRYHWQIIIKAKQRSALLSVISALPANWSYDIDPSNLL